jgi:hypothetical protein
MAPVWSYRRGQYLLLQHAVSSIGHYGVSVVLSNLSISILNVGWLSFYCRTPQERSIAMA